MSVDLFVTYLEMIEPPRGAALAALPPDGAIARERFDPETYLGLYRAVGGPWQWDQRLQMPRDTLRAILARSSTHLYVLRVAGHAVGFCEFERVGEPDIELTNFGLVPHAQGQKFGPFLLDHALRQVWSQETRRIWLHTDTNDHPKAIATYERAGFRTYMARMETFPD